MNWITATMIVVVVLNIIALIATLFARSAMRTVFREIDKFSSDKGI